MQQFVTILNIFRKSISWELFSDRKNIILLLNNNNNRFHYSKLKHRVSTNFFPRILLAARCLITEPSFINFSGFIKNYPLSSCSGTTDFTFPMGFQSRTIQIIILLSSKRNLTMCIYTVQSLYGENFVSSQVLC